MSSSPRRAAADATGLRCGRVLPPGTRDRRTGCLLPRRVRVVVASSAGFPRVRSSPWPRRRSCGPGWARWPRSTSLPTTLTPTRSTWSGSSAAGSTSRLTSGGPRRPTSRQTSSSGSTWCRSTACSSCCARSTPPSSVTIALRPVAPPARRWSCGARWPTASTSTTSSRIGSPSARSSSRASPSRPSATRLLAATSWWRPRSARASPSPSISTSCASCGDRASAFASRCRWCRRCCTRVLWRCAARWARRVG
jgi:hypothetical protein